MENPKLFTVKITKQIIMKNYFLGLFLLMCFISTAQNNYIVKTDDGRRVLLKADYTWEYIDLEKTPNDSLIANTAITKPLKKETCATADFTEPKLNAKIQSQLKRGRATIKHVKAKVAKDYNCNTDEVILLSFKEQKAKATYNFCVKGNNITYKRIGNSILKKGELF